MARRLTVGFESRRLTTSATTNGEGQATALGGGGAGSVAIDTTKQWSGSCCAKFPKSVQSYLFAPITAAAEVWQWGQLVWLPGSSWTGYVNCLGCSVAGKEIGFYVNAEGKEVGVFFQGAGEEFWVPDEAFVLPNLTTEHHIVELGLWPHASEAAKSKARLVIRNEAGEIIFDHQKEGSIGGTGELGTWTVGGLNTPTCDIYVSQFIVNDSTGSAENGEVGHQKVVMLKPYEDESREGWLNGGGGSTSLYDAVNNYPPVGVANGSKSATSQVYNATSTTTQKYIVKCISPVAPVAEGGGGMGVADRFTTLMVIGRFANSATTARGYGLGSSGFPSGITEKTDSTISGTAAGTEPTGWKTTVTTPIYAEEGGAKIGGMERLDSEHPRIQIRKNASSTNALACDMLGYYVTYEPDDGNLIGPGDLERSTEDWFTVGSTIAQSETQRHSGVKALKVTPAGTGSFNGAGKETLVPLVAGTKYLAKAWVYRTEGKNVRLYAGSEGGAEEVLEENFVAAATGWALYEWEFTAGESQLYQFNVRAGETSTEAFYVDDVSLVEKVNPTYNFFGSKTPSWGAAEEGDPSDYNLGFAFETLVVGWIKGVRFYFPKTSGTMKWPVIVGLWTNSSQSLLAEGTSVETVEPTEDGWIEVEFDEPFEAKAGETYVVAYIHDRLSGNPGYWAASGYYFTNEPEVPGIMVAPLWNNVAGGNGRFEGVNTLHRPENEFEASNYAVDVIFEVPEEGGGKALTLKLEDTVAPAESRGKRDAVKRADALASVSESRSKRPGLARSDSQALADALKRSVIERRPDTVALAELLKRTVGTSRVETLALADKLAKALGIRQEDAAVVVEAMGRRAGVARADGVEATESQVAAAELGKADSFGFGESLVRDGGSALADGILLAELLAHAWIAQRELADTIPLDDEFVIFLGKELDLEDTTALSDALVRVWAATSGLADVLAPEDAQALDAALKRADTASVVALISNEAGGHRSDSLSVSDAHRLAAGLGLAEQVAVIDAIHPAEGIGIGNMFALEDAVARAWAASLARADTFDLTDTARLAAERPLVEALGVADADARAWAALREAEDVFAVVDAVEAFSSKGTNPHETLKVAEALERMWEAIFDRADAVTVVEAARLSYGRFLGESVHLPETHLRELGKHFANQIELSETLQRTLGARYAETLEGADQVHQALAKSLHELVFVVDSRGTRHEREFLEALELVEARRAAATKLRHESIEPTETWTKAPARPLSDAAAFADQMRRAYRLELSESILPLEYRVRSSGLGKADELAISDAIDVLRVLGVYLDEALAIADGLRRDSVKALEDLAELEERVEPHGTAAHEAILVLADALTTQTLLDDAPEVGIEVADRRSTTLSVEDGLS